ncbi:MAG: hypothetical protein NC206_07790 [Bacteroides sp.]|nr:hypothetical protein [Roseburia sp.]MCM1346972.1 hypothetical protein [Bacteroides sp.]MCM1421598.1 hypothetical protein [Bacteroides sp.]
MKNIAISCILFFLVCACREKVVDPVASAKSTLAEALDSLHSHHYGKFMSSVDFGEDMSEEQRNILFDVLRQHQERQDSLKGYISSCEIVDVDVESDSVITLYYSVMFADGNSEVNSQKMVRIGNVWKIRVRN